MITSIMHSMHSFNALTNYATAAESRISRGITNLWEKYKRGLTKERESGSCHDWSIKLCYIAKDFFSCTAPDVKITEWIFSDAPHLT